MYLGIFIPQACCIHLSTKIKTKKKTNKKDGRFAKRKGKEGQGKSKGIKGQEQGEAPLFWAGQEQGGMPLLYPINYIPRGAACRQGGTEHTRRDKNDPSPPPGRGGRILYFRFYGTELTNKGLNNLFIFNRLC
uniref:Uncharacterized protein n=1 Tax=Morchella importuna TaxID=1174673 RepID=A0A650AFF4_9PEZI|nr:hypothetical protein [Morchella importuna]QGN66775.1 hypothetical protein [Morchella importuna]